MPKSILKDLTGQRFGKLLVIERAPSTSYGATRWRVKCDCDGRETVVFAAALVNGRTASCGCGMAQWSHRQSGGRGGTPSGAYGSWHCMIQRCTNPKHKKYADYGGRGITVCARWRLFENFYADLGDRPPGMSLEREDVNGNYDLGNCCWATTQAQARNTRASVVTFDDVQEIIGRFEHGETQASIGRRFGIKANYISKIIHGDVWTEIDRPYLANWKRCTSALVGDRVDEAKEHAALLAKSKAGSTYQHDSSCRMPDLIGHRFGLLVVLRQGLNNKHGSVQWVVRCDCSRATEKSVTTANLVHGRTTSCGCMRLRLTHGQSGGGTGRPSGAYVSWHHMIQRCTNLNCPAYPGYGGRGIDVCERWMKFEHFYADKGDRPEGASLERRDVNGNYDPDNCYWGSSLDQARNTRATVVTFDGVQEILGRFEHGESRASIGRRLGINPTYVGAIIKGKAWAEIDRPYLKKVQP